MELERAEDFETMPDPVDRPVEEAVREYMDDRPDRWRALIRLFLDDDGTDGGTLSAPYESLIARVVTDEADAARGSREEVRRPSSGRQTFQR
jgi:hypothetical protein